MQLELSLDRLEVRDGPLDATWSKYKAMLVPGLVWTDQAELDASLNDNTQPTACPCLAAHSTLDDLLRIAPCGSCQQRRRFTYVALQKALARVEHCLQLTKLPSPETLHHQRTLLSGNLDRYETTMLMKHRIADARISLDIGLHSLKTWMTTLKVVSPPFQAAIESCRRLLVPELTWRTVEEADQIMVGAIEGLQHGKGTVAVEAAVDNDEAEISALTCTLTTLLKKNVEVEAKLGQIQRAVRRNNS